MSDRIEPGYADIQAAALTTDQRIEVTFANGDVVVVPPGQFGLPDAARSVAVVDGLAVQVTDNSGQAAQMTWDTIRLAQDPDFAAAQRRQAEDETRRVGRRLRALREDRGVSRDTAARAAGMSRAALARLEDGEGQVTVSTVRAVLAGLGASIKDIAGVDAPEVSTKTLRSVALRAGVPAEVFGRLANAVTRRQTSGLLARAFDWTLASIATGPLPAGARPVAVAFKSVGGSDPRWSPLLRLAFTVADLTGSSVTLPPRAEVPSDAERVRADIGGPHGVPDLASTVSWAWRRGIPVLPLIGSGGFSAAVLRVSGREVIVLKESRELAALWLFDLAHEIGHIVLGHTSSEGVVDVESPASRSHSDDRQERDADEFALAVLLPQWRSMLAEVRAGTAGRYLQFKGAVAAVAERHRVNAGLLGLVAAYEMTDIGQPKDRWGSATNLARSDGPGRSTVVDQARRHLDIEGMEPVMSALMRAVVLSD